MGIGEGDAHLMDEFLTFDALGEMLPAMLFEGLRTLRQNQRHS
jgi:hypothetical protein